MKFKLLTPLLVSSCLLLNNANAISERGLQRLIIKDSNDKQVGLYKQSHALVIGVSDYQKRAWPDLSGVKTDIRAVKSVLQDNGFHVVTVENPTGAELGQAFARFIQQYGNQVDNRLLFYFAGHGYSVKPKYGGDSIGYIVPKDAPSPLDSVSDFKQVALSLQRIEEYAASFIPRFTLLYKSALICGITELNKFNLSHITIDALEISNP